MKITIKRTANLMIPNLVGKKGTRLYRRLSHFDRIAGMLLFLGTLICSLFVTGCGAREQSRSVTVFAASSTADVIKKVAEKYEKEYGVKVKINIASSGKLARQIESGAHADIYVSASKKWADYADSKGLLLKKELLLGNQLVLVTSNEKNSPIDLVTRSTLSEQIKGRISIGDPNYVPAGKYGKEALSYLKSYERLNEAKRLVPAQNVRAALMTVELGETEYGIIYKTDAMKSKKVHIVGIFPDVSHQPISYVFSLCKESGLDAQELFSFMMHQSNEQLYKQYGFIMMTL